MQAELAREETDKINKQVIDITRTKFGLTQALKNAQDELTMLRPSAVDTNEAAEDSTEPCVVAAETRAREVAVHVAGLDDEVQEATEACERMRNGAEAANAGTSIRGRALSKLTVRGVQTLPLQCCRPPSRKNM